MVSNLVPRRGEMVVGGCGEPSHEGSLERLQKCMSVAWFVRRKCR